MKKIIQLIVLIIIVYLVFSLFVSYKAGQKYSDESLEKTFMIEKGQGVTEIAKNLEEQGLINSDFWFKVYVWKKELRSKFFDGEFSLNKNQNIKEIVKVLTTNQVIVKETDFTIIEGWSIEDIAESLDKKELVRKSDFLKYVENFKDLDYEFLVDKPKKASLEGYLYPDTYRVYEETSIAKIVEKALSNFDKKLTNELREEINRQGKDIFEVLILASIVEKEVFGYEERRKVADIFLKRLKINMPLQADSTVNYITKSGRASSTYKDLKIDNPYNTYKYYGLPPGPICNPSIESIKSVIYPQNNNYYYFLTSPEGKVHYAATLAEHNANFKYLK